jgi:hypothetical protein
VEADDRERAIAEAAGLIGSKAEVLRLVADYQAAEQAWRLMPKIADTKDEVKDVLAIIEQGANKVDDMTPKVAEFVYGPCHADELAILDRHARLLRERLAWLDRLRPGGGAGHLGHVVGEPPPRFALARSAVAALERHRPGSVTGTVHGPLYRLAELVLTLAGTEDPQRGLAHHVQKAAVAHRADQESGLRAG